MRVIQALRVRECNPAGAGVVLMAKSGRRASQGVSTKDDVCSKQNHTRFREKNSPSVSTSSSALSSATN